MITRLTNCRIIGSEIPKADIYIENEKITGVSPEELPYDKTIDMGGSYASPGFIDTHCHGGGGSDFADGDEKGDLTAVNVHLRHGTTTIYPTIYSSEYTETVKALEVLRCAMKKTGVIGGVHLEGPYFSLSQCGAQNMAHITPPVKNDYEDLIAGYGDIIKRWSYAPERDAGLKFTKTLKANNIIASAGHTDAVFNDMERAFKEGCNLITHLYSCTSTVTRDKGFRRPGVIESAFIIEDINVEMIADGRHLPLEMLYMVYRIKGKDHVMLVTDALRAAGTGDTETWIGSGEYRTVCPVEDGVVKLPDRSAFAGSIATADMLLKTAVESGIKLSDAVCMMTKTPAKIMGLESKGNILPGYDADIVFFDDKINISEILKDGVFI